DSTARVTAARGRSMSTPASRVNVAVTRKKISRMNTTSIRGAMSIAASATRSRLCRTEENMSCAQVAGRSVGSIPTDRGLQPPDGEERGVAVALDARGEQPVHEEDRDRDHEAGLRRDHGLGDPGGERVRAVRPLGGQLLEGLHHA